MKKTAAALLSFLLVLTLVFSFAPEVHAEDSSSDYFGTVTWYSTASPGGTVTDSFYFSDSWFFEDPAIQNDSLALASMQLTAAASDAEPDGLGISFLKDMGFEETGVSRYDSSDPYDLVYTWGKKSITNGSETSSLICISVQSYAFDKETKRVGWNQNFRINGDSETDEHYSYETAAGNVLPDIAALGASGPVKYWITGQSRGGALAGMLAAKLPSVSSAADSDIYAYTFESPAVVNAAAAPDPANGNIHNYICSDDIVPKIPFWGMVRYGVDHQLNTEETDAGLLEMLQNFGSASAIVCEDYSAENITNLVTEITGDLENIVPTRADYSANHADTVTGLDGTEQSITYNCQGLFLTLMDLIFGDGIGDIDTDYLLEHLDELIPTLQSLVKAINEDSDSDYYQAAENTEAFLSSAGIFLPFETADLYVLLKLVGPLLIDTSYVPASDPPTSEDVIGYITPAMSLFGAKDGLIFSHQFDTAIARLKILAGEPALDNIALTIPEPAAGDANTSAPEAVLAEIDAMGCSWITADCALDSPDETLQNDKVYYLDVTLTTLGHSIPEDLSFTINGNDPAGPLEISEAEGVTTIRGQWALTIGSPAQITVSFDANGRAEAPASVSVDSGAKLAYVLTPESYENVTDDQGTWRFNGWYDEDGTFWKDLIAQKDVTLYAKWNRLIDEVSVTVPIPHVGDALPVPSVPEGALYTIQDYFFEDTVDYEEISSIDSTDPLTACIYLYAGDEAEFQLEKDEWDSFNYTGTCSVNGEEAEMYYDEDLNCLRIYYSFTPLPAEDPVTETPTPTDKPTPMNTTTPKPTDTATPKPTETPSSVPSTAPVDTLSPAPTSSPVSVAYTVVGGVNARWTKGSTASLTITVKRNKADETCFLHFTGVSIDGTALAANDYVAKSGSTIVTLSASYLEKLSVADHTIAILFDDGKAETSLKVAAGSSYTPSNYNRSYTPSGSSRYSTYGQKGAPGTGDPNQIGLWIGLAVAAAAVIVILIAVRRKKS